MSIVDGPLGDLLRQHRLASGLTQEALAEKAKLSVEAISALERGTRRHPHRHTILQLADALGLTADEQDRLFAAAARRRSASSGVEPVPRQLPFGIGDFVGRESEIASMTSGAHASSASVIVVTGMGGVGKTSLATHWAHRMSSRYPGGQLYVNLRGFDPAGAPADPSAVIRSFLEALEVPPQRIPAGLDAQAALYRTRLAGRRMLILLDNARDAAQVRPLLPGTPGCLALVTSRNQMIGLGAAEGARSLRLDLLSTVESRELLVGRLGEDRADSEPGAIDDIIALCARLPLALAVTAALAASQSQLPLAAIVSDMHDTPSRLDAFRTADPVTDIRAVFSWSQQHLSPAAARLFSLLGLHPGPEISLPAAASLAAEPVAATRILLAELTRAHLLNEHRPGRFALHDLLRAYTAEHVQRTEPGGQRHAATQRLLDHYLHTAHAADRLISPLRDPIVLPAAAPGAVISTLDDEERALEWLTTESHVLLSTIGHYEAGQRDAYTWQLSVVLTNFLFRRGYWHDQVATGIAAIAAARRTGETIAQILAGQSLARAYVQLGDYDRAQDHLQSTLALAEESADLVKQADTHHVLSWVMERTGRHTESFTHARQAVSLYQAAGYLSGEASALNTIGWFHALLGQHHQALTVCQQALRLHQQVGNDEGQAATLHSLGYAHHHLGDQPRALDSFQRALTIFRELRNRYYEGDTLARIGDTYRAIGDREAASTAWRLALAILDDLNHPDAEQVRLKCFGP